MPVNIKHKASDVKHEFTNLFVSVLYCINQKPREHNDTIAKNVQVIFQENLQFYMILTDFF